MKKIKFLNEKQSAKTVDKNADHCAQGRWLPHLGDTAARRDENRHTRQIQWVNQKSGALV